MHLGPVTIDGVTVLLRPPRLADGPSWRETALAFEERLSPAFDRDDMDWESAHSPVMWVDTWRAASADARAGGVSYLLVRIDDGSERVVGHFLMAGRDHRTGGAEISTWAADVPSTVSAWAQLTTVLSAFDGNPAIPHALAPAAVSNVGANRFAESMGWTQLQTRRALRRYGGQVSDHHIWFLANTAEYRDWARRRLSDIPVTRAPFTPPAPHIPSAEYLAAWLRFVAIRARLRLGTLRRETTAQSALEIPSGSGEVARIERGDSGQYRVTIGGRPAGSVDVYSDIGTSTTELVPRLTQWVSDSARVAVVSGLAGHLAQAPAVSRRTTVVAQESDATLADRLATLGFADEGAAPAALGEDGPPRRMWTRLRNPDVK